MPRFRPLVVLLSAGIFVVAGIAMLQIRSISGDSVAEVFYQAYGILSFGLAGIALLLGFVDFTVNQERQFSRDYKRCVQCQEFVPTAATKCGYCTTDLIGAEAEESFLDP